MSNDLAIPTSGPEPPGVSILWLKDRKATSYTCNITLLVCNEKRVKAKLQLSSYLHRLVSKSHQDFPLSITKAGTGDLKLLIKALEVVEVLDNVAFAVHIDPLQDTRLCSNENIEVHLCFFRHVQNLSEVFTL